jgi:hypothetical protein
MTTRSRRSKSVLDRQTAAPAGPAPVYRLDVRGIDTSVPALPALMSVEETAAAMGLCGASVRSAIHRGEIPARKLMGRWKIVTKELIDRCYAIEAARLARIATLRSAP